MNLKNKTALVTGASRGIGRAIALRLAREGAVVAVHYKENAAAAAEVVAQIEHGGGRAVALGADLGELTQVNRLSTEFKAAFGGLDILVNNAGWAAFEPLGAVDEATYDTIFNLNVKAVFFLTQELLPLLRENGRIVNISSGITRVNAPKGSVYAASKSAVEAFTRSWAAELGSRGITVNTVSPGMTETDLLRDLMSAESMAKRAADTPLGRLGQPADIADAVALLCFEEARWVTAQNLLANGGAG